MDDGYIGVAGDEQAAATVFAVTVTLYAAYRTAVHMDADGHLGGQGVPGFVHIAYVGRDGFDVDGQHVDLKTGRHPAAV